MSELGDRLWDELEAEAKELESRAEGVELPHERLTSDEMWNDLMKRWKERYGVDYPPN